MVGFFRLCVGWITCSSTAVNSAVAANHLSTTLQPTVLDSGDVRFAYDCSFIDCRADIHSRNPSNRLDKESNESTRRSRPVVEKAMKPDQTGGVRDE
ncbi:hypothetical protein FN846DRAFT_434181 [Sphaerosporella brunnea]|uniref:Secreted protein n=1 Tax=Sphaerosporella brunnea TaxID=1250544 RepID=A0A5J5EGN5_9PEZI|nr:hypothetical protein FN846DRAFT_434181 [Sphaerosporella brunnea]